MPIQRAIQSCPKTRSPKRVSTATPHFRCPGSGVNRIRLCTAAAQREAATASKKGAQRHLFWGITMLFIYLHVVLYFDTYAVRIVGTFVLVLVRTSCVLNACFIRTDLYRSFVLFTHHICAAPVPASCTLSLPQYA